MIAYQFTRLKEPSYPLAGEVTRVLTSRLKGVENFHKAIHFTVRETIENSFEHGRTDHCFISAYSVPSKNVVRLCILDTGIGIPESLNSSGRYAERLEDTDAILHASEYGVSSKSTDRGIGLYILRDVVEKNEGTLTLISVSGSVEFSCEVKKRQLKNHFNGTIIKLMLRTKKEFHYIDTAGWEAL